MTLRFSVCLFLCACGGVIDGPGSDSGLTDTSSDAASKSDGAVDCTALTNQLAGQEPNAIQCCSTCNIVQCSYQVPGLCCPLSVTSATSDAVKIYEATLAQIQKAGCLVSCPAIACSTKPSGVCSQTNICAQ
jgi:hypothetical protein